MNEALLKVPPPLPPTRTDLLAQFTLKRRLSINELVQEVVIKLWEHDEDFMRYINAIYDSEAVEGSLDEDDTMAAQIIRRTAEKDKNERVASQKLKTIKLAMRVVLRRFDIDRNTRFDKAELPPPSTEVTAEAPAE